MESPTPRPPTGVDELDSDTHARRDDPWPSHAAAAKVDLTRRQVQVLRAFQEKEADDRDVIEGMERFVTSGLTDEELVKRVQAVARARAVSDDVKLPSPSGLRTARKALFDAGLVERYPSTGEVGDGSLRKTELGNWAFVWVLTQAGRDFEVPQ